MSKLKKLFLLVPLMVLAVLSAQAGDIVLKESVKVGNEPAQSSWYYGKTTIPYSAFANIQANDQIIVQNLGNYTHLLRWWHGAEWSEDHKIHTDDEGYGDSFAAKGTLTYTIPNDQNIINCLKKDGLVLGGVGSSEEATFNIKVTLRVASTNISGNYRVLRRNDGDFSDVFTLGSNDTNNSYGGGLDVDKTFFSDVIAGDKIIVTYSGGTEEHNIYVKTNSSEDGIEFTWRSNLTVGGKWEYTIKDTDLDKLKADGLRVVGYGSSTEEKFNVKVCLQHSDPNDAITQLPTNKHLTLNSWGDACVIDKSVFEKRNLSGGFVLRYKSTVSNPHQINFLFGGWNGTKISNHDPAAKYTFRYDEAYKNNCKAWFPMRDDLKALLTSGGLIIQAEPGITITDIDIVYADPNPWGFTDNLSTSVDVTCDGTIINGTTDNPYIISARKITAADNDDLAIGFWATASGGLNTTALLKSSDESILECKNGRWYARKYGTVKLTGYSTDYDGGEITNNPVKKEIVINVGGVVPFTYNGSDGQPRNRHIRVVAPNTSGKKYPLIISLHGAGQNIDFGAINFDHMVNNSEKPFVVVYPVGTYQSSRGPGWDATRQDNYGDLDFMKAIVNALKNNPGSYGINGSIDDKQVYICGHSNGGMFAYEAIAKAPDVFAGGASTGGFPLNEFHLNTSGDRPVPFFHIQGGNDDAVAIQQTLTNGKTGHLYYDFETIIDNMVYRNGCYPKPTTDITGTTTNTSTPTEFRKRLYTAVGDGIAADFQYHYVKNMGHTWWAGDMGYDIPGEIWNFFKDRPLNETPHQLQFRSVVKSQQSHQNGFNMTEHGWHVGQKMNNDGTAWVADDNIIASYGEGKTDVYFENYDPTTGHYTNEPQAGNHDIYHSIQLKGWDNNGTLSGDHYIKFNTSATNADFVTIRLYKYVQNDHDAFGNPNNVTKTEVFSKRYNVNQTITLNFTAETSWTEYYVEFEKGKPGDDTQLMFFEILSGTFTPESGEYFYDDLSAIPAGLQLLKQPVYGRRAGQGEGYSGWKYKYKDDSETTNAGVIGNKWMERDENGIRKDGNSINPDNVVSADYADDQAREYIVLADRIERHAEKNKSYYTEVIPRTWSYGDADATDKNQTDNPNHYAEQLSGSGLQFGTVGSGYTSAYIMGANTYVDDKLGLCISKRGKANFANYAANYQEIKRITAKNPSDRTEDEKTLLATNGLTKGVIAFRCAGTMDIMVYLTNKSGAGNNNDKRRKLHVYYMNDYIDKPVCFKEWNVDESIRTDVDFDGYNAGIYGSVLEAQVRLPQLGTDGTCFVYFAYEGVLDGSKDDDESLWIQGFMIHRPDLKVTIGRTDKMFYDGNDRKQGYENNDDVKLTGYGENQPYVWKFENNDQSIDPAYIGATSSLQEKSNLNDYRTYVQATIPTLDGKTENSGDHLLVYSEYAASQGHFVDRKGTEPAHLQFDSPTQIRYKRGVDEFGNPVYATPLEPVSSDVNYNGEGSVFDPIVNDGLKVNVTGSGWFKVRAKVPKGQHNAKMTIMTSPNGGIEHINLLRYFKLKADGEYHEYVAYLKARPSGNKIHTDYNDLATAADREAAYIDAESQQQSLFVVFEDIGGDITTTVPEEYNKIDVWEGDKNNFQVNIDRMEWLNDEVPDYVFQREQYLFKSQEENENVNEGDNTQTGHINYHYTRSRQTVFGKGGIGQSLKTTPILYWQAGGANANAVRMVDENNKTVHKNGIIVDKSGQKVYDNALEDGGWAYDTNWQFIAGGTDPKFVTNGLNYTECGARPHKGNLSIGDTNTFGGWWDMAPMPELGLENFVKHDNNPQTPNIDDPNVDGVYSGATCSIEDHNHGGNGPASPLWQGAHTEMQSPRIFNQGYNKNRRPDPNSTSTISEFKWNAGSELLFSNATVKGEVVGVNGPDGKPNELYLPVSGPFYRFMPMKNVDITAYVVSGNTEGRIYVLDERGYVVKEYTNQQDGYYERGSVKVDGGGEMFTTDADNEIVGSIKPDNVELLGQPSNRPHAVKIVISARAGKEYFLCSTGMAIGVAAMYFDENTSIPKRADNDPLSFDEQGTNAASTINTVYTGTNAKCTNVTIKRKFEKDRWYSLVLPFSMNEAKFEEVFGAGAKCLHFEKVDQRVIYLLHHRYNMIVAGRPVFIRPTNSFTSDNGFVISDVTIQNVPNVLPFDEVGTGNESFQFYGNYEAVDMKAGSIVMTTNTEGGYSGQLVYMKNNKHTKGLRAWIQPAAGNTTPITTSPQLTALSYGSYRYTGENLDDEDVTGIAQLLEEEMGVTVLKPNDKIYDLNGRVVGKGSSIDALPAGVYIINGKKIVK